MKLNDKIYSLRKRLGLSQEDLASALGVSRQSVSNWETGSAKPEIGKLPQLAQVLGVTVDFLLDEAAEVPGSGSGSGPDSSDSGDGPGATDEGAARSESSSDEAAAAAAATASTGEPGSYPEWLDHLPRFLQRSAHRYGWIFGIRYAIGGLIFVVFGFIGRAMVRGFFRETGSLGFGNDAFVVTSGDLPSSVVRQIEGEIGGTPPGSSFMSIIPNAAIVIGVILIIGGLALAYALKQWGRRHQAEDEE